MGFLTDAQQEDPPVALSTFTESVRLVTLYGHSISHQRQGTVEFTRGSFSLDFWGRHQQLNDSLTRSIDSMSLQQDPCVLAYLDPMPLFTHMAAQAAVLVLYMAGQGSPWGAHEYPDPVCQDEHRALMAAQQMVALSKALIKLSYFKVRLIISFPHACAPDKVQIHPFTPVLLYLCGSFLQSNLHLDPTFEMQAALQEALQSMARSNCMAEDCLNRLDMPVL